MSIIQAELTGRQVEILEALRTRVAEVCGVTLIGNRLTARWHQDGQLVDAHMLVLEVTTVPEAKERGLVSERYRALYKKYPGLEADLYFAEEGVWPK